MGLLSCALTVIYFIYFSKEIITVQQLPKLLNGLTSVTFNTLDLEADNLQANTEAIKFDADSQEISAKTFYTKCVSLNKVCFVKNYAADWKALDLWRFDEGQEYLKGKIEGDLQVYLDASYGKSGLEDDIFKNANLKLRSYK